ncbi:MAG TPA: hypothetical protein VIR77_03435, partial [Pontiella sp.]
MPAKRKYTVKQSSDFLVLAGIFFFLGLWAIKDAWYPSEKTLKKHPQEIVIPFTAAGSVDGIHVAVGDAVDEGQLLVNLRKDRIMVEFEAATNAYIQAKNVYTEMELEARRAERDGGAAVAELKKSADDARAEMTAKLKQVGELRQSMESMDVLSVGKGKVKEIPIRMHDVVEADDEALVIVPDDDFYLFNKS